MGEFKGGDIPYFGSPLVLLCPHGRFGYYPANVSPPVESWVEYYSQVFVAVDGGNVMGGDGAIRADIVNVEGG